MTESAAPTSPEPTNAPGTKRASLIARYGEQLALPVAWFIIIVFFSIQEPDLFPTSRNLGSLLGTQTALFIVALAALLPAMAGDLDLSLGWAGAFGAMVMAVLNTQHGWGIVPSALVAIAIGAACGFFNGFVVVKLKTEPFIMTLGTGAVFQGFVLWVSDSNTVTNVARSLSKWTLQTKLWVIPIQFFYALAIMLVIWWVAEHTPLGVRWLFVGNSGSMSPVSFSPFLLPAYAAVFLGATTIHPGRFNPIGTMIAVLFLATGVQGLRIMGADDFTQFLFYGGTLVVAVAGSRYLRGK